ncbi:hypothetical protein D3C87_2210130 [compost metagenome]
MIDGSSNGVVRLTAVAVVQFQDAMPEAEEFLLVTNKGFSDGSQPGAHTVS